jgi:phosphate transport system substrate-binding protein
MAVGEYIAVLRKSIINMKSWHFIISALLFLVACNEQDAKKKKQEEINNSNLRISVDESFKPVIEEELKVFESAYPAARVFVEYKPEAECLRDLEKDSTKIVIISRELSRDETKYYNGKIGFKPEFSQVAKDAIAVIVNGQSADSSFTISELRQLLAGRGGDRLKVAIDGNTATSTVRYLKDSLLKGENFGKSITGAKNSEDLINYISATPSAVGFVGISWITNPQNAQQEQAIGKIKMALIECRNCEAGTFARPSQQTITFKQYPLVRGLYYVLKENYPGLGSRFIEFLSTERGQLIFRRALLVPTQINFNRRRII